MQNQTPHPMPFYTIEAQTDLEIGLIEEFKRVLSRVREFSSTKENALLIRKNYGAGDIHNCTVRALLDTLQAKDATDIKNKFHDFIAYCLMLSTLSNELSRDGYSVNYWSTNSEDITATLREICKTETPQRRKQIIEDKLSATQQELVNVKVNLKHSEDARVDAHNKFEFAQDKLESMFNELARTAVSLDRAEIELITLRDKLARYERKEQEEAVNSFKQDNAARLLLAKKPTPADLYGTIKSEVQLNEDGAISGFGMASTTTEKLSITADSFDVRLVACENKLDALANRVNNVIERKE